jgi:hypothetical protein
MRHKVKDRPSATGHDNSLALFHFTSELSQPILCVSDRHTLHSGANVATCSYIVKPTEIQVVDSGPMFKGDVENRTNCQTSTKRSPRGWRRILKCRARNFDDGVQSTEMAPLTFHISRLTAALAAQRDDIGSRPRWPLSFFESPAIFHPVRQVLADSTRS